MSEKKLLSTRLRVAAALAIQKGLPQTSDALLRLLEELNAASKERPQAVQRTLDDDEPPSNGPFTLH